MHRGRTYLGKLESRYFRPVEEGRGAGIQQKGKGTDRVVAFSPGGTRNLHRGVSKGRTEDVWSL